jgi:hypothetical protein
MSYCAECAKRDEEVARLKGESVDLIVQAVAANEDHNRTRFALLAAEARLARARAFIMTTVENVARQVALADIDGIAFPPTQRAQSAGEEAEALVYLDKLIGDSRSTITQGSLEKVAALIRKQASALAEAKEALSSAPIPSKYHGQRGFELERFLADYETFVRNKLRSLTQEPSSAG